MSERIICMPDDCVYGDVYYPDERDDPMALRERVVRCCDCMYYKLDSEPIDPGWPMMCELTGADMVEPDGFCAWGERRDA